MKPVQHLVFCSIATASHLRQVLPCLERLRQLHPGAEAALLLVDADAAGSAEAAAAARCLAVDAVVPAAVLRRMRRRYTPAELCFALKPFLLEHLLETGAEQAHYLDGDCIAFHDLQPLIEELAAADLLLTPHCLSPIPDDGRTPRALTVLRGGVFNGGYIGVRNTAEGRRFTRWLAGMTERYARNAPAQGMCGDQRWLDLVPVLFPGAAICRRAGANVAYWNLHERTLARDPGGGYRVNGEPLLFFHYSGYRPEWPLDLSVHQNRHTVEPGSPLRALLEEYRGLLEAAGATAAPGPRGMRRWLGRRAGR